MNESRSPAAQRSVEAVTQSVLALAEAHPGEERVLGIFRAGGEGGLHLGGVLEPQVGAVEDEELLPFLDGGGRVVANDLPLLVYPVVQVRPVAVVEERAKP